MLGAHSGQKKGWKFHQLRSPAVCILLALPQAFAWLSYIEGGFLTLSSYPNLIL